MMRKWFKGAKSDDSKAGSSPSATVQPEASERPTAGSTSFSDAISSITMPSLARRGAGSADAEIERKVSLAARNLCYGVQSIVMAAKNKSGTEWKSELLTLLGGSDEETPVDHCDVDILLLAPKSEKFVQRCLENELPPNMIHCLRLLRVLELQHAVETSSIDKLPIKPISSQATAKVGQLLCMLCMDSSVGEQLRPHLFGLLALSGASYPPSGVHVAKAASQVIIAFSEKCLSKSLITFLHERKMIIHMTDDIKELCGITSSSAAQSNSTSTGSLYGLEAEAHGLWAIALSTVITLVTNSCRHDCGDLLSDFEAAKGSKVLLDAIQQSRSSHAKKLVELVPLLAMCKVPEDNLIDNKKKKTNADDIHKLATNPAAFEIMDDLMYRSIPLLKSYREEYGNKAEITNEESIQNLAMYALRVAGKVRFKPSEDIGSTESNGSQDFNLATDLLLSCLNLYSEHTMNFDMVEARTRVLTFYILAFPTFRDENLKVLILKTLEFVVTGVPGSNTMQPFSILSKSFVSICRALLNGGAIEDEMDSNQKDLVIEGLFADTDLINESLEKLFQFDSRVGPAIIRSGTVTHIVNDVTKLLLNELAQKKDNWRNTFEEHEDIYIEPPEYTPVDKVCAAFFRVLALVMGQQSKTNKSLLKATGASDELSDIRYLLETSVKELGEESAKSTIEVLQKIMWSREDIVCLREDMEFCFELIDYFTNVIACLCGVSSVAQHFASRKTLPYELLNELEFNPKSAMKKVYLTRVLGLFGMLRTVLQASDLGKDAFRLSGGFERITKISLAVGGLALQDFGQDNENRESLLEIFETLLSVIESSIGFNSRDQIEKKVDALGRASIVLAADTLVDSVSTQHSIPNAAARNLYYLRLNGFYLDFAIAMSQTKILEYPESAIPIMELAMSHMDPSFNLARGDSDKGGTKVQRMRNPDAARLVLGLVLFIPNSKEGTNLAKRSFDQIIRLCDPSRLGSTLSQVADCGLVWSITNPREFASVVDDTTHPLYTRFTLLLRRIAAFSMSYSDFVSLIRGVAGPLLYTKSEARIRLPVISASIRQSVIHETLETDSDAFLEKDADFCRRLESLCAVAERGERVPYITVGGDSINTLSVLLHKTKVEDRLYKAAEDGRLNFLEVDCIDSAALKTGGFLSAGVTASGSSGGERVWAPIVGNGFSFSAWFRYPKLKDEIKEGNIYLFDLANPTISTGEGSHAPHNPVFLSLWYDLRNQRFNLLTSTSARGEPTSFPVSPLVPTVWHHVLLTYTPTKRTMMGRKSVFAIYVDGRPLEAEVKVESVNIAPNAKLTIGAPNPAVSVSGVVRGMIPIWEIGPTSLFSTVLMQLDATAMFIHGPDFQGYFWGDRPQRLSLSATGSSSFALLAETGEPGSVASALRRRDISRMEAAGIVSREMGLGGGSGSDNDSLAALGLLCSIPPETVVFAYRANVCTTKSITPTSVGPRNRNCTAKLPNMARMVSSNESVSHDACMYGKAGVVTPRCFADNVQWAGGPEILMPLINASISSKSLALAMRLIRASIDRHPPNLEAMQGGGGFQMLATLMQGKKFIDQRVIDESFAFAVHGFTPTSVEESKSLEGLHIPIIPTNADFWVFSDLDAMKQLLLNHQVWDLRNSGPELPLRLITFINGLVGQRSIHKAFNSRRLHLVGIVRWTLHLMIEAAELYSSGEASKHKIVVEGEKLDVADKSYNGSLWYCEAPLADTVSVGGDPSNTLLHACKALLRRVLTFMLTPGDLDAIADTIMHTINIGGNILKYPAQSKKDENYSNPPILFPGTVARVYLLRLVEELVVDGVNEIVASAERRYEGDPNRPDTSRPHAGGIANPNQSYLPLAMLGGRPEEGQVHPKHQQAQNFLTAFAGVFTPVWFAALLEGCHEEASASAVLRLMILMHQSSPAFASKFEKHGGFAPLILSIPKYSTCPSVIISLLSQLFNVSILHLPCFSVLDAAQLNEVFDSEKDLSELLSNVYQRAAAQYRGDTSSAIFALLTECIGRNIHMSSFDNDMGMKAKQTNAALIQLLQHRHNFSKAFQQFCRSREFVEPLSQLLCLLYSENRKRASQQKLVQPHDIESSHTESEAALVHLLRLIVSSAVMAGPIAPVLAHSLMCSFPIHATNNQVEAYQLVILDICQSAITDAVDLGEAGALASSIGILSSLVDCMMKGFFNSEASLSTVKIAFTVLRSLTAAPSSTSSKMGNVELGMITADSAHIARIASICALRRSRHANVDELGGFGHQDEIAKLIATNIYELMTLPKVSGFTSRRSSNLHLAPAVTSKMYPLWVSASLFRCEGQELRGEVLYQDLSESEEPLRAFVTSLMVEVAYLLNEQQDSTREAAITIVVALLQEQRAILSGLLVKEYTRDDKVETLDVMNRGGFGALLVAHEVAVSSGGSSLKKNYGSFFDWFDKHQKVIQRVFTDIEEESSRIFPGLNSGAAVPGEAIESQQQKNLLRLASSETADRTIVGGLERSDLVKRSIDKIGESHSHWRRLGFDDLASGAMLWKYTLRRMKGSSSIWEGGPSYETKSILTRHKELYSDLISVNSKVVKVPLDKTHESSSNTLVTRWKLDLTEGYERQRRRLLPNYEFHSLYNVDETHDIVHEGNKIQGDSVDDNQAHGSTSPDFFIADGMEATTALLKDLKLKKVVKRDEDEGYFDEMEDDHLSEATSSTIAASIDSELTCDESNSNVKKLDENGEKNNENNMMDGFLADDNEHENASSYELITGLLQPGDWPEESYNVRRCTGLEVRKALLLWCRDAIYVIDGFEQSEGEGLEGKITRVEKEESTYNVSLRPKDFKVSEGETNAAFDNNMIDGSRSSKSKAQKKKATETSNEVMYQHRSQRIAFKELHSVFRRRYQLQQCALEFYDIYSHGTLVSFSSHGQREEILTKVLSTSLPNSIFGTTYGASINYKKFMSSWKARITSQWINGKMTNFDFLMHLNSFAGRTYNDLTQYPIFPWVIADYESEEIDLDDPRTYRDLTKPMGALGTARAQQFRDRYESLAAHYTNEEEPPPFHYGTHYSCAAYVLYYLMRLEPFSRLALSLQGGKFDVADRLFHNIPSSWKSASEENLQDVRELIPEFFYLSDFLTNTNGFDFGTTQKGKTVHDVTLPKWAKGDPNRFIRINRQALESEYVSKHLHAWVDLIFGYKQRGEEAVKALNTFVHVTYEGEVDLESMSDPVQRESTIAQIQNFGQTPSRLERRPFPQRYVYPVLKEGKIDFGALSYLAPQSAPFCVVGAPHRCRVKRISTEVCKMGIADQKAAAVGDMCLVKGQLIGVGRMCSLHIPSRTYFRFGLPNNGLSVHVGSLTARNRELNKTISMHDGLHRAEVTVARASLDGRWIITGCMDSTVRVWKYESPNVKLCATLCGHEGWKITCADISTVFGMIVTGCARGRVLVWDLVTLTFIRRLDHKFNETNVDTRAQNRPSTAVSINHKNGNIVTLVGPYLSIFDVNGRLLGSEKSLGARPTCSIATDCPEWQNGIVAVTGHINGEVRFWSLDYDSGNLTVRDLMVDMEHRCEITALRATGETQDTLLIGDSNGKMSICRTLQLENMSSTQISEIASELHERLSPRTQHLDQDSGTDIRNNLASIAQQGREEIASSILNILPGKSGITENEPAS